MVCFFDEFEGDNFLMEVYMVEEYFFIVYVI